MPQTALLVIDVQDSFKQRPYWDKTIFSGYAERQARLIERARQQGWPLAPICSTAAAARLIMT